MELIPKVEMPEQTSLESGFQFNLHAATSSVGKVSQPTITYLNQGQIYKLTLKKDPGFGILEKSLLCQVSILLPIFETKIIFVKIEIFICHNL